jgi:NAD(P)-dependent dehydrogenase (short-subunit alcohol dehydrogenase family)
MFTRIRRLICAAVLLAAAPAILADTVFISGANSGLGLELATQYAKAGWDVIATHRRETDPESLTALKKQFRNVRIERMDVTERAQVEALAAKLKGTAIDVLINNAGVMFVDGGKRGGQRFGELDFDVFDEIMDINVRGSMMVTQNFIEHVKASKQKKIIAITSSHGSIGDPPPTTVNAMWYGASKAALNKLLSVTARVVAKDGVIVVPLHPGSVRVDGSTTPLPAGMIEAPYACGEMIKTIAALTPERSGHFLRYDGASIAW